MLDAAQGFDCIAPMKTKFFLALMGLTLLAVGCVDTVSGSKAGGAPFVKDKIRSRYERPSDEVYQAAKEVVAHDGVLINENILHGQTNAVNQIVRAVQGMVNECRVWVSVEQIDPRVTAVTVQTRTKSGFSDIDLAAQIDKEIALKLVR
jgi:Protein of unknown function (DUF3568)